MTPIPLDLLWRAWPDGYLPLRGVATVGGWICADPGPASPLGASLAVHWAPATLDAPRREWTPMLYPAEVDAPSRECDDGEHGRGMEWWRAGGNLLPRVDPTDIATWACLMHDLGEAMVRSFPAPAGRARVLPWGPFASDEAGGRWHLWDAAPEHRRTELSWAANHPPPVCQNFPIPHDADQALALVYARIDCRKRGF